MSQIAKYVCDELENVEMNCVVVSGEPWFKELDVAIALKYTDTDQAIRKHVSEDDKRQQGSFNLNPVKSAGLKGNWKMLNTVTIRAVLLDIR